MGGTAPCGTSGIGRGHFLLQIKVQLKAVGGKHNLFMMHLPVDVQHMDTGKAPTSCGKTSTSQGWSVKCPMQVRCFVHPTCTNILNAHWRLGVGGFCGGTVNRPCARLGDS
jgi:hypothetical protein